MSSTAASPGLQPTDNLAESIAGRASAGGIIADLEKLKQIASDAVDSAAPELEELSRQIWLHPELHHQEHKAHQLLTDFLQKHGFAVERKYKLETAFRATVQTDGVSKPNVAILCEYDALPGIGHGCGHNLIAEVGVGASLGVKAAMLAANCSVGRLTVLGTPAEEEGGGKIDLIRAGAFRDVDAAIMSHPGNYSTLRSCFVALQEVRVTYRGKASHAACDPWEGINALDAAVMAYSSISCLRQQMRNNCRVHGIISKGGLVPNIIPEEAELFYYIRAPTEHELGELVKKVKACFEAAAIATGCKVEYDWDPNPYYDVVTNKTIGEIYEQNARRLGVKFTEDRRMLSASAGSTDMGNVSHVVPAIHPIFHIGGYNPEHSLEFARQAGSAEAQVCTLREAKVLAFTALEILFQPGVLQRLRKDFDSDVRRTEHEP